MNLRFDFVMHWLYAIVWALLALSGFGMAGAKYGWLVNFNYATADYIHRVFAGVFVILTLISIFYEIWRNVKSETKKLPWFIFGKSGYQLFTFIMTLILIVTGALIWICIEFDLKFVGVALLIHEYISYIMLASIIWHVYKKVHALKWPARKDKSKQLE